MKEPETDDFDGCTSQWRNPRIHNAVSHSLPIWAVTSPELCLENPCMICCGEPTMAPKWTLDCGLHMLGY
jgi:hypothetical protein